MKRLILILLALFTIDSVSSQTSETSWCDLSSEFKDEIVRTYNYPQAVVISYDYNQGGSIVCLKTNTNVLYERYFSGCHIHDFVISDDTVFFCGEGRYNSGIIGFFDINDFFYHTGDYYIIDTLPILDGYYASNLTKLVTYLDAEYQRHVFAIGYTNHKELHNKYGCVVDLLGDVGYMTYNAGYVDGSLDKEFTDVEVVGKYVVTVGYGDYSGVDIRIFYKDFPFLLAGPQNRKHRMEGVAASGEYRWNEIDAQLTAAPKAMPSDVFAVASIFENRMGQYSTGWKIHLAELNVNSIAIQSTSTILTSRKLESMSIVYPHKLHEFRYNPSLKRYSILFQYTSFISNAARNVFVEMSNHFSGSVMTLTDIADEHYELSYVSFDQFLAQGKYLLAGDKVEASGQTDYFPQRLYFQLETSGLQSLCLPKSEWSLSDMNSVRPKYIESPIKFIGRRTEPLYRQDSHPIEHIITIECSN